MKAKIKQQAGIGVIGIMIILMMIGAIAHFGLKVFPLYVEYGAVKKALGYVEGLPEGRVKTTKAVYTAFRKNTYVNGIKRFSNKDGTELIKVKKDKKTGKRFFNVKYQASETLYKNIKVMIDVDETVPLAGN